MLSPMWFPGLAIRKGKGMPPALLFLIALCGLIWLGFRIMPPIFPALSAEERTPLPTLAPIPIPEGLPAPVERFYRSLYGDSVPQVQTAVIDGRARLKPFGFFMPSRFRFIYNAGADYHHYIESTFFGIPLLRVNESWIDGISNFRIPFIGASDNDPQVNDSANLGLWAEMTFLPSVFLTDPRVHWLPLDDDTAILEVPYAPADGPASTQRFIARFDPASGLLRYLETMRFRSADNPNRILWITETLAYDRTSPASHGPVVTKGSVTWFDQGAPWAYFMPERYQINLEVDTLLQNAANQ